MASPCKTWARSSGMARVGMSLGAGRSWISSLPKVQKLAEHAWRLGDFCFSNRQLQATSPKCQLSKRKKINKRAPNDHGLENLRRAVKPWLQHTLLGGKKPNALNVGISAHVPSSLRCPSTTNFPGSQTLGRWSCCSPGRFSKVQMLGNESTPSSLRSKD